MVEYNRGGGGGGEGMFCGVVRANLLTRICWGYVCWFGDERLERSQRK